MTIDPRKLSRREFARLTAAASITALTASGCREVGARGTTIRFWNGFTGPDGTTMLGIIRRFNALHDDVQVTMQRIVWDTYYNKVFVAGLGGRAPEVFVVQVDHLERFIWGKLCAPVDSIVNAIGPDEFDSTILKAARRGATTYAVPLDIHPVGCYYNRALFAQAGIAAPPTNRAEFLDAIHKLKKGDATNQRWGFVYEWQRVNLYSLVRQWGGDIIAPDLRTTIIDSREAIEAVEFGAQLIADGLAAPIQNTNAMIGFRQGRVAMIFGGTFLLNDLRMQTDLDFAPAVVPTLGNEPGVWAGSHMMCLRNDLGERERAAAEKWVRYLSDNSLLWADAGQVPVRKKLRETDTFKAMPVQSTFAEQIPYAKPMPSTTFTREYQIAFDTACEAVLRQDVSAAAAMGSAAKEIRMAAARFAPNASGGVP
jgi:multiple sugar transport system substrate-binding protein